MVKMKINRLIWFGNVTRKKELAEAEKMVMKMNVEGRRRRG